MVNEHMNHANAYTSLLTGESNEVHLELCPFLRCEVGDGR